MKRYHYDLTCNVRAFNFGQIQLTWVCNKSLYLEDDHTLYVISTTSDFLLSTAYDATLQNEDLVNKIINKQDRPEDKGMLFSIIFYKEKQHL